MDKKQQSVLIRINSYMKQRRMIARLSVLLVCSIFIGSFFTDYKEGVMPNALGIVEEGDVLTLRGVIYQIEEKESSNYLYLKVNIEEETSLWRIQDPYFHTLHLGNEIEVTGNVLFFSESRNPGNFDASLYYDKQKLVASIYVHTIDRINPKISFLPHYLYQLRKKGVAYLKEAIGPTYGGLLSAMIFGDKSGMDSEQKERFQKIGISHIFAISGLHISLISLMAYEVIRRKSGSFLVGGISGSIILILYIMLTGVGISAIRAGCMFIMKMGGDISGRVYDVPTGLGLAAIIVLTEVPNYLFDGGFLLSFGAILGVLFVLPVIQLLFVKWGKVGSLLGASIGIQLMLLPVIFHYFYEVCLYSPFINVMVIPLMPVLLGLGILGVLIGLVWGSLGVMVLQLCSMLLQLMDCLSKFVLGLPFARIILGQIWWPYIILYYGVLLYLIIKGKELMRRQQFIEDVLGKEKNWYEGDSSGINGKPYQVALDKSKRSGIEAEMRKSQRKQLFYLGVIVSVLPLLLCLAKPREELEITIIDVGQGDGIYVRGPAGGHYLIDGGSTDISSVGKYRIEPYLLSQGVWHLDYVFISHGDADHYNGVQEMIQRQDLGVAIYNLVLVEPQFLDEKLLALKEVALDHNIPVLYMGKGDYIKEGDLVFTCIAPGNDYTGEIGNPSSMVIDLKYYDFDMLFTGDLEGDGENAYLKDILENGSKQYDVLKVAHHGSKNSTPIELLDILQAKISVVSAGVNNRYGHPHKETIEKILNSGSSLYTTNQVGAIEIKYSKNKNIIKIEHFL